MIDDEPAVRSLLASVLRDDGWEVYEAGSAHEALQQLSDKQWRLVFCDVVLGGPDGYSVLRRFREAQPDASFILMTGQGSAAGALDATSIGAYDYLLKPFTIDDIPRISGSIKKDLGARKERAKKAELPGGYDSDIPLIGSSPSFVDCLKMVGRVARTSLPVLITGESGTGKEVIARAIHERSKRSHNNLVTVNCGAIPTELIESELFGHAKGSFTGAARDRVGMWEEATGGTLFLDEITETNSLFQVKLLRALQEGEIRRVGSNRPIKVDVRVIAATNRDIEAEVKAGRFREDLMYRLNAVTIDLPPLRHRSVDVPLLAEHFVHQIVPPNETPPQFTKEAMAILQKYNWPGNIRELENAVLRSVTLCDGSIYPEHLPARIQLYCDQLQRASGSEEPTTDSSREPHQWTSLSELEQEYVHKVLAHTGGNKQLASRILNIDRKTLARIANRK